MGIFDFIGKNKKEGRRLENYPEMLNAQLLFFDKPTLNKAKIIDELSVYFGKIDSPEADGEFSFFFPEFEFDISGTTIPGQCAILELGDKSSPAIPDEAFQQNWHWQNARETATQCTYGILISDLLTRTLHYKLRVELFMKFLVAVTKATNPQVIYSIPAKKLIDPAQLVKRWDGSAEVLTGLINVRLFKITNSNIADILMDTVGLSYLGLPDFQMFLKSANETRIAQLLWNYAYYIFERGDIIESGQTLEGVDENSKWKCERKMGSLGPERIVIDVHP